MVAPGLLLDPLEQLLVGLVLLGGPEDLGLAVDVRDLLVELLRHPDALDHGEAVLVGLLLGQALVERVERDQGGVARVGARQLDGAGGVAGVGLQHEPGPPGLVVGRGCVGRVAGVEASEEGREAADPEILLAVIGVRGCPEGTGENLVRSVGALGGALVVGVDVLVPARVVFGEEVGTV